MRLIHTKSLQFKEYAPDAVPGGYAILSHRWVAGQEISFQEMLQPNRDTVSKTGYTKIKGFCERAAFNNFQYAWIDTCCINKESSAELSDAINSMFQWYQNAAKCYVYLNDVENISQFSRSEWFQRGWTLQELLAPDEVQFFSKKWMPLGRKKDQNIIEILSTITKIPEQDLKYDIQVLLLRNSLARRMSWASQRKTTRAEDMAYCLLGLFGVNMDLRYGEGGANAFLRLQEHIIKISDDTSIFAWSIPSSHARADFGLLAPSVDCFVNSHEIGFMDSRPELFGMTQKGLRITLSLRCMIDPYYFADINFYGNLIMAILGFHNSAG
ncbi:hypothetical protein N7488_004699 [Penicillium malachiteum]|nr:hypothetical protein N7488_004699 [Penicillium malachiteum]